MYYAKNTSLWPKITIIEFLITLALIIQIGILIEYLIYSSFATNVIDISDGIIYMSDNNTINDNIPRNRENPDFPRIIRYFSTNIAALALRRPFTRVVALALVSSGNILADILSNEERANYWIDQYNFYLRTGRLRGGQEGFGPFERIANSVDNQANTSNSVNNTDNISNFLGDFNFIRDFLSPVDHSIPLETLINLNFIMNLGLFLIVICLIVLTVYFYINLIILFNKDYFLNKVKNKYVLMYVKYVIFKTRVDIFAFGIITLIMLFFMAYILHYLIVHPIIIK